MRLGSSKSSMDGGHRSLAGPRYFTLEEEDPEAATAPACVTAAAVRTLADRTLLAALRADEELIEAVDARRYQCYIGPEEYDRLHSDEKARRAYYDVLRRTLEGRLYDVGAVSRLCADIADELKAKAKQLYVERYKIVASVVIGQQSDPSARVASRCLWDSDTDKFHNVVYSNGSLFAVATVFGVIAD